MSERHIKLDCINISYRIVYHFLHLHMTEPLSMSDIFYDGCQGKHDFSL
jgi:hypothetical protein